MPERRHARSGLHQQRIHVAVIAAFELDGKVAARESARHAQRAHGGFGPGIDQAHHLDGRHALVNQLGQLHLALGGRAEAGSDRENLAQRVHDRRKAVAQDQRSPGQDVVDVLVAVDVVDVRSLAACDERRRPAHAAKCAHR